MVKVKKKTSGSDNAEGESSPKSDQNSSPDKSASGSSTPAQGSNISPNKPGSVEQASAGSRTPGGAQSSPEKEAVAGGQGGEPAKKVVVKKIIKKKKKIIKKTQTTQSPVKGEKKEAAKPEGVQSPEAQQPESVKSQDVKPETVHSDVSKPEQSSKSSVVATTEMKEEVKTNSPPPAVKQVSKSEDSKQQSPSKSKSVATKKQPKDGSPKEAKAKTKDQKEDVEVNETKDLVCDTLKINLIHNFEKAANSTHLQTVANPPNLLRRFKINLRLISPSFRNKVSARLSEVDRVFVCRRPKEQRSQMGIEFEDISLTDAYLKSYPHRIKQKYGNQFVIEADFSKPKIEYRTVSLNPEYEAPKVKPECEREEEEQLDEQKIFQSLHEALEELKKRYGKTTEFITELFVRVCGDLTLVENALKGHTVPQWTYLEDLALTKNIDSQEYQWLVKSKGQKEILKRRKFLLTADSPEEAQIGVSADHVETAELVTYRKELEEEDLMHDPNLDETVPFL